MSRASGQQWERVAERWLCDRGARILKRNFNCRGGEIDLVINDHGEIAFVEVKFRASAGYGDGAAHVTYTKQRRIERAARVYLQYHVHAPDQVCRFDVVSIGEGPGGVNIQWIKNAFDAV